MSNQENQRQNTCPHLGLISDPKTATIFPTSNNACQLVDPPAPVAADYQRSYCLSKAHVECPGFISGWPDGFPKELKGYQAVTTKSSFPNWIVFAGTGILIIVLVIGALSQLN